MIGFGFIEVIFVVDILVLVDEMDYDGDGIFGRFNIVWLVEFE